MNASDNTNTSIHIINAPSDKINRLTLTNALSDSYIGPIIENKVIVEKAINFCCRRASFHISQLNFEFGMYNLRLLISKLTANKTRKILLFDSLLERILQLAQHPFIAEHASQRRTYGALLSKCFRPHMANKEDKSVAKCVDCSKCGSKFI